MNKIIRIRKDQVKYANLNTLMKVECVNYVDWMCDEMDADTNEKQMMMAFFQAYYDRDVVILRRLCRKFRLKSRSERFYYKIPIVPAFIEFTSKCYLEMLRWLDETVDLTRDDVMAYGLLENIFIRAYERRNIDLLMWLRDVFHMTCSDVRELSKYIKSARESGDIDMLKFLSSIL